MFTGGNLVRLSKTVEQCHNWGDNTGLLLPKLLNMNHKLKRDIVRYLHEQGADKVGVASCKAWPEAGMVPEDYWPHSLWPAAKSVVVIGLQMLLPIVETTPSSQHMELYRTCNRVLDSLAFNLTRWLNRQGHASVFFSRDGYARIDVLLQKPAAAFAHIFAARYAGLGHVSSHRSRPAARPAAEETTLRTLSCVRGLLSGAGFHL